MITPTPAAIRTLSNQLGVSEWSVRQVIADLAAGVGITTIGAISPLGYQHIRTIANACGWTQQDRVRPPLDPKGLIGRLTRARVLKLFDHGIRLATIADRAGVSYERIRQVAHAAGRPPRAIARRKLAEARRTWLQFEAKRKSAERQIAHARSIERERAYMAKAKHLWAAGSSVAMIARTYDVPANSMAWYIHNYRQRFGDEDFPHRR